MQSVVQTFFIDPFSVGSAASVKLTSIDLYFKTIAPTEGNQSGNRNPGVTVILCDVENDLPVITKTYASIARRERSSIVASPDASAVTKFVFPDPIAVASRASYGIIVQFDDPAYELWTNKAGDITLADNLVSPGATGARSGELFQKVSDTNIKPMYGQTLKYQSNVAKFSTVDTAEIILVNDNYEFVTHVPLSGSFREGELVFANTVQIAGSANIQTGSNVVVGSGTSFATFGAGRTVIFQSGTTYAGGVIASVANNTHMTLIDKLSLSNTAAIVYPGLTGTTTYIDTLTSQMVFNGSTANTAMKFTAGMILRGLNSNATSTITTVDNFPIDQYTSHMVVEQQVTDSVTTTASFAYSNGSAFISGVSFDPIATGIKVNTGVPGKILLSRSNEMGSPFLYSADRKSAVIDLTFSTTNPYTAPRVVNKHVDVEIERNKVSANTLAQYANNVIYDREVVAQGGDVARHITSKITFEGSRMAEDIRVFLSAYKPQGTDIKLYAKIHNANDDEPFDDKLWTPMIVVNQTNAVSSSVDATDILEYQFGLPLAPPSITLLNGSFTTEIGSRTVTGVFNDDLTTVTTPGQLVKIYSAYFPQNYMIGRIASRTTNSLLLESPVTDNNVVGPAMRIDPLLYGQTAFSYVNVEQGGVIRYYNSTGAVFDKYSTAQIKIVLTATAASKVPFVDQIEVIGVSV
jgi:hypothetical protein